MAEMRKSKFTEEQIIGFLKQAEAGIAVVEICRKGGFSDATFYKWRAKFGGMEASDAKRLRELESENAKLKSLLAEAHPAGPRIRSAWRPPSNAAPIRRRTQMPFGSVTWRVRRTSTPACLRRSARPNTSGRLSVKTRAAGALRAIGSVKAPARTAVSPALE
jgi:putative transposase